MQYFKALFLNFQGRIWVFVNITITSISFFASGQCCIFPYYKHFTASQQVHIMHVSVILNLLFTISYTSEAGCIIAMDPRQAQAWVNIIILCECF
jgi:hypothetical protein